MSRLKQQTRTNLPTQDIAINVQNGRWQDQDLTPTLYWLNDDEARRAARDVPYRLLEEGPALSYGDPDTRNLLIQGDNLAALKSLLPYYDGQVK